MPRKLVIARESGAPASANERTLERLHASGAVESAKQGGTFRIRVITEGKGSSGFYPASLMESESSAKVIDGLPSFFDHPDYSFAPEERSVLKLAGRLVAGTVEQGVTEDGLKAIYSDYKPRDEYLEFFKEFADIIGVSVYIAAAFTERADGERQVEQFLEDPYNSVDIVVAAGRGGRFEQARESLQTIQTSLGIAEANKPSVEASAQEEEGNMTKEEMQAILAEALAPVLADVAALKTAATEKAIAEADAEAISAAVAEALESYDEKVQAITAEADLFDSARVALMESAREGNDITEALESAKAQFAEAKAHFATESAPADDLDGFVFESGRSAESKGGADVLAAAIEGVAR